MENKTEIMPFTFHWKIIVKVWGIYEMLTIQISKIPSKLYSDIPFFIFGIDIFKLGTFNWYYIYSIMVRFFC